MKRIAKNICLLLLLCACVCACFGCGISREEKLMFDTELFRCIYNEEKTEVTILELTEKGAQQEILVIPETINGLPVVQLGGVTTGVANQSNHAISSKTVKKIYISRLDISIELFYIRNAEIVAQKVTTDNEYQLLCLAEKAKNRIYTPMSDIQSSVISKYCSDVNVYFYLDQDDDDPFFVDYVGDSELHIQPQVPSKKGYVFGGWYIDRQCVNKWDGEYAVTSKDGMLTLYANWITNSEE